MNQKSSLPSRLRCKRTICILAHRSAPRNQNRTTPAENIHAVGNKNRKAKCFDWLLTVEPRSDILRKLGTPHSRCRCLHAGWAYCSDMRTFRRTAECTQGSDRSRKDRTHFHTKTIPATHKNPSDDASLKADSNECFMRQFQMISSDFSSN